MITREGSEKLLWILKALCFALIWEEVDRNLGRSQLKYISERSSAHFPSSETYISKKYLVNYQFKKEMQHLFVRVSDFLRNEFDTFYTKQGYLAHI
jgi:hypothetical protein